MYGVIYKENTIVNNCESKNFQTQNLYSNNLTTDNLKANDIKIKILNCNNLDIKNISIKNSQENINKQLKYTIKTDEKYNINDVVSIKTNQLKQKFVKMTTMKNITNPNIKLDKLNNIYVTYNTYQTNFLNTDFENKNIKQSNTYSSILFKLDNNGNQVYYKLLDRKIDDIYIDNYIYIYGNIEENNNLINYLTKLDLDGKEILTKKINNYEKINFSENKIIIASKTDVEYFIEYCDYNFKTFYISKFGKDSNIKIKNIISNKNRLYVVLHTDSDTFYDINNNKLVLKKGNIKYLIIEIDESGFQLNIYSDLGIVRNILKDEDLMITVDNKILNLTKNKIIQLDNNIIDFVKFNNIFYANTSNNLYILDKNLNINNVIKIESNLIYKNYVMNITENIFTINKINNNKIIIKNTLKSNFEKIKIIEGDRLYCLILIDNNKLDLTDNNYFQDYDKNIHVSDNDKNLFLVCLDILRIPIGLALENNEDSVTVITIGETEIGNYKKNKLYYWDNEKGLTENKNNNFMGFTSDTKLILCPK